LGKEVFQARGRALGYLVEEKLDESLVRLRLLVEEKLDESLVRLRLLVEDTQFLDSQAGYHVYISQSGGHWAVAEKEGICAI
jgi:hypothetical protein